MTFGLCSVNDLHSRYELTRTEPCRDAPWCEGMPEVPEAIPLSSGLSSVAAVMPSPSLAHGEVAASPVPLTCRLLDPGSGGSSQLRRGTVSTWDATE